MDILTLNAVLSELDGYEEIKIFTTNNIYMFPKGQVVEMGKKLNTYLYIHTQLNDMYYIDIAEIEAIKLIKPNE